jgi:hypothetical protein
MISFSLQHHGRRQALCGCPWWLRTRLLSSGCGDAVGMITLDASPMKIFWTISALLLSPTGQVTGAASHTNVRCSAALGLDCGVNFGVDWVHSAPVLVELGGAGRMVLNFAFFWP